MGVQNTAMFALVEPPSIWVVVDSTDTASCGTADGEAYLSAYGGFAVPTSTAAYVVDSTEGEFEPYGIGQPLNANSYEVVTPFKMTPYLIQSRFSQEEILASLEVLKHTSLFVLKDLSHSMHRISTVDR